MRTTFFAVLVIFMLPMMGWAQDTPYPQANYPLAKVSFRDFKEVMTEVETHRESRLIDFDTFLVMGKEPGVVILDTRSSFRFERIHLKGAKHLAFTDFTQENLAKLIPDPSTKILIYCNNNFEGNQTDFATKVFVPNLLTGPKIATQIASQEKPRMMALNIPSYINLYGYGYRNVYELHELVDVKDSRVEFEGSVVANNALRPLEQGSERLDQKSKPLQQKLGRLK